MTSLGYTRSVSESNASQTAARAVYYITPQSSITIFPETEGSATVKLSTSAQSKCFADVMSRNFTTGQAAWQDWESGSVSTITSEIAYGGITCAAVVPASGLWTIEVSR